MLQTAKRAGDSASSKAAPHERYLEAFRWMLLARVFEEKLTSLYRGGMISGGVYVGRGQEAVSVAGAIFCKKATFSRRSFAIRPGVLPGANRCSRSRAPISARARVRCADATATFIAAGLTMAISR